MFRLATLIAFTLPLVAVACGQQKPLGKTCALVTDCDLGDACVAGVCVAGEGEGEGAGEGEGEGVTGGEGEGSSGCVSDADCGRGDVCQNGTCVPTNQGPGCHNDGECSGGQSCVSPDAPTQCGAPPPPPPPGCSSNADCSNGDVCDFVPNGCGGGDDECVPPCASDADCRAGEETCNAGRCETIPCTDTTQFVCPSWTACGGVAPNPLDDDSKHGCVPIACTLDTDCPFPTGGFVAIPASGHCVDGECASGPGQCELPVP